MKTRKVKRLIYNKLPDSYKLTTFSDLIDKFESITGENYSEIKAASNTNEYFLDSTIQYKRYRFVDIKSDSRFNLDTDIKVFKSKNTVSKNSCSFYNFDSDVFEIKGYDPLWAPYYLKKFPMQYGSFSKFLIGKEITSYSIIEGK